jgi:hypothetical protein
MSQPTFDRLMRAIRSSDRGEFLLDATEEMRRGVTQEVMARIIKDLTSHLQRGFEATHVREAQEDGFDVNLWKVAFKDGSDDVTLRVVTREGKLAGFWREPHNPPQERTAAAI